MTRRQSGSSENVRMGPVAIFTLVTIICLAVLAVLSVSTSNATVALAERRAQATSELYLNEAAGQAFLATLDEEVSSGADGDAAIAAATEAALESAPQSLADAPQLQVSCTQDGSAYHATFDCGNRRQLHITVSFGEDGAYRVEEWRVTSVQNDEPVIGDLLGSS